MLTVKLDPKLRDQVRALASELGVTASELVREALRQRVAQRTRLRPKSVYAATRDLCGVAETSDPELSSRRISVLLALAERTGVRGVLTVDAKDFAVYRLSNGRTLNNLLARA